MYPPTVFVTGDITGDITGDAGERTGDAAAPPLRSGLATSTCATTNAQRHSDGDHD
jgi:hypothetical protein